MLLNDVRIASRRAIRLGHPLRIALLYRCQLHQDHEKTNAMWYIQDTHYPRFVVELYPHVWSGFEGRV